MGELPPPSEPTAAEAASMDGQKRKGDIQEHFGCIYSRSPVKKHIAAKRNKGRRHWKRVKGSKYMLQLSTGMLVKLKIDAFHATNGFYISISEYNQWCKDGRHTQQQAEDGPQSKWNVSSSEALDSSINKPDLQWKGHYMQCTYTAGYTPTLSLVSLLSNHTHTCTCTHTHTCTHTYMHAHTHAHTHSLTLMHKHTYRVNCSTFISQPWTVEDGG